MQHEDDTLGLDLDTIKQIATDFKRTRTQERRWIKDVVPETDEEAAKWIMQLWHSLKAVRDNSSSDFISRFNFDVTTTNLNTADLSEINLNTLEADTQMSGEERAGNNGLADTLNAYTLAVHGLHAMNDAVVQAEAKSLSTSQACSAAVSAMFASWERTKASLLYNATRISSSVFKLSEFEKMPFEILTGFIESSIAFEQNGKPTTLTTLLRQMHYPDPHIALRNILPGAILDVMPPDITANALVGIRKRATNQITRQLKTQQKEASFEPALETSGMQFIGGIDDVFNQAHQIERFEKMQVLGSFIREAKDFLSEEEFQLFLALGQNTKVETIEKRFGYKSRTAYRRIESLIDKLNPIRIKHGLDPFDRKRDFG